MEERLDRLVCQSGLAASGERAKMLIRSGRISVEGKVVLKPGRKFHQDAVIELIGESLRFVSRGGYKLEKAMDMFGLDATDAVCLDIGASTGGFTDCLLQRGAARVYAVDVGSDQLHPSLIADSRVVNLEKTHVKTLDRAKVPEQVDLVTIDVSFISLSKILPHLEPFIQEGTRLVALVKPQFEAGPAHVGKGGVVRRKSSHTAVLERVVNEFSEGGWATLGMTFSPAIGPKGNLEFLAFCVRTETDRNALNRDLVSHVVDEAHDYQKKGGTI